MQRNKLAIFIAVFVSGGCSPFALAQTNNSTSLQAEELIVEGTQQSSENTIGEKELERKIFQNLGDALATQPGVHATAFGATASRPVMRGLEGERVQIFENGMSAGDMSGLSNDHAPGTDTLGASKVEILRGPDALKYGSASSGGLINIQNARIPQELPGGTSALVDGQYGSNDRGTKYFGVAESQMGNVAVRADFGHQNIGDYKMPNGQRLAYSSLDQNDFGLGTSFVHEKGFTGFSVNQRKSLYGIPSSEGGMIDLVQDKFDFHHLQKNPFNRIEAADLKISYTDYQHRELSTNRDPVTQFKNQQLEARLDLKHLDIGGWKGGIGAQVQHGKLVASDIQSAKEGSVIPKTDVQNFALYAVEKKTIGQFDLKLGSRYEIKEISPSAANYSSTGTFSNTAPAIPNLQNRKFNLFSFSSELNWNYQPGYATSLTYAQFARAPGVNELFAYGPHESTATFDVGSSSLNQETSRQWELAWKKTTGFIQGQVGVFQNNISNYTYGAYTGATDNDSGFAVRQFEQGQAKLTGAEASLSLNRGVSGWSGRLFGDFSRGSLNNGTSLPLQPAPRLGMDVLYQKDSWEGSLSWVHAFEQTRLASFENSITPAYNRIDARIAYNTRVNSVKTSIYLQARNLLNEEIRYSTTVEGLRNHAPQAGRSVWLGLRLAY
jgi:iron complex outermembrane receptor protein